MRSAVAVNKETGWRVHLEAFSAIGSCTGRVSVYNDKTEKDMAWISTSRHTTPEGPENEFNELIRKYDLKIIENRSEGSFTDEKTIVRHLVDVR